MLVSLLFRIRRYRAERVKNSQRNTDCVHGSAAVRKKNLLARKQKRAQPDVCANTLGQRPHRKRSYTAHIPHGKTCVYCGYTRSASTSPDVSETRRHTHTPQANTEGAQERPEALRDLSLQWVGRCRAPSLPSKQRKKNSSHVHRLVLRDSRSLKPETIKEKTWRTRVSPGKSVHTHDEPLETLVYTPPAGRR